eukprot:TRINITY_DN5144_c0_g1_i2.p1 TRINITY_DN5144_c0_g1~~TRINITY_DN5144_c0_g1_i2.p1  ORF type:complete len:411 (+),score=88.91 TRINITY_DN5144_c0_g1_i2:43-1275(+)
MDPKVIFERMARHIIANDFESLLQDFDPHVVNMTYRHGSNLLHLSVRYNRKDTDAISLLLTYLDPNLGDDNGNTPLHIACIEANEKIVQLLLKSPHMNPNITNNFGDSALHVGCNTGHESIVKILLQHPELDTTLQNFGLETAQDVAIRMRHQPIVNLFDQHHRTYREKPSELEKRKSVYIWKPKTIEQKKVEQENLIDQLSQLERKHFSVNAEIQLTSEEMIKLDERITEMKSEKQEYLRQMNSLKEKVDRSGKEMEDMKDLWKRSETLVRAGVENCSSLELRELLEGEGIEKSTIQSLELNNINGSILLRLTGDAMKDQMDIGWKDVMKLRDIIRCWKKREMVDEDLVWINKLDENLEKDKEIPNPLLCPITQEIMNDPVMASDGHTYERSAIEEWIRVGNKRKTQGP